MTGWRLRLRGASRSRSSTRSSRCFVELDLLRAAVRAARRRRRADRAARTRSTRWSPSSARGRDLVVAGLNELPGVSLPRRPHGAFYAFPNVAGTGLPADELAGRLLDEAGVAVLAGSAFGEVGEGNLRLSYANSQDNLREALRRMRTFLEAL